LHYSNQNEYDKSFTTRKKNDVWIFQQILRGWETNLRLKCKTVLLKQSIVNMQATFQGQKYGKFTHLRHTLALNVNPTWKKNDLVSQN